MTTGEKISAALRGKPKSPEHRAKLAAHLARVKGNPADRVWSGESRRKLSAAKATGLSEDERFWSKVQRGEPDACWPWTGYTQPSGYGIFAAGSRVDGSRRRLLAHRVAWAKTFGPVGDGIDVLHSCDNPPCCNPSHLFLGNQKVNMTDCSAKHRTGALSRDQVRSIRTR